MKDSNSRYSVAFLLIVVFFIGLGALDNPKTTTRVVNGIVKFIQQSYGISDSKSSDNLGLLLTTPQKSTLHNSEVKAILTVWDTQEVEDFKQLVKSNGKSTVEILTESKPTNEHPYFTVKVFENFPDRIVTFGFYRYNPTTGELLRLEVSSDTWIKVI